MHHINSHRSCQSTLSEADIPKQFERFPFQSNMAAAFKFSGIAAANQTETKVVITDNTVMLSLHFLKVDEDKNL